MALALATLINTPVFAGDAVSLPVQKSSLAEQMADLEVFVRNGCPHCADAEVFLQSLQREQPQLNIVIRDVTQEPAALNRLQALAEQQGSIAVRVPAFLIGAELLIGYAGEATTGQLIRSRLAQLQTRQKTVADSKTSGSCEAEQPLSCEAKADINAASAQPFRLDFLGYQFTPDQIGLPLFTLAMGLLDGFNPCSLWVLILMISLLAPMRDRWRMFAVAGVFIAVEGAAYFLFMSVWLNLFLLIGLSRISEIIIALVALLAGTINLKDYRYYGRGISLSIPNAAKPGIYGHMRGIITARNLAGAMLGSVLLAILVQIVEFMCTSGFPALYTRILTMNQLDKLSYYAYLLLYNLAYMLDDVIILSIGIVTLSQKRLQEKEGRWLKLISGLVMVGLGVYLLADAIR